MSSLVMSPFLRDYTYKNGNRLIKVSAMSQLTYTIHVRSIYTVPGF